MIDLIVDALIKPMTPAEALGMWFEIGVAAVILCFLIVFICYLLDSLLVWGFGKLKDLGMVSEDSELNDWVILILLVAISALVLCGCRTPGPSRDRLKVLLHEAREENRECHQVLKYYQQASDDCATQLGVKFIHPEQKMGSLQHGEAGF